MPDVMQTVRVPVIRCPTCDTPYVLRWTIHIMTPGPPEYIYQRDCKHRSSVTGSISVKELETAPLSVVVEGDSD